MCYLVYSTPEYVFLAIPVAEGSIDRPVDRKARVMLERSAITRQRGRRKSRLLRVRSRRSVSLNSRAAFLVEVGLVGDCESASGELGFIEARGADEAGRVVWNDGELDGSFGLLEAG